MAEIVIHAGMPKTGSTSLQRWLVDNAERLRTEYGIQILVANGTRRDPTGRLQLEPYESGNVNSGLVAEGWGLTTFAPEVPLHFLAELGDLATQFSSVLLTGEGLSRFLWTANEQVLGGFQDLARRHTVRVAYYVRPQHTALEAMWREDGFLRSPGPRQAIIYRLRQLHYLQTLEALATHAPDLDFVMCPFRSDLLVRGNVIDDFATRFLGIEEECPRIEINRSLPLRLVNVLRSAPDGVFRSGETELYPRAKLRRVAARLDLPSTPEIRRSRRILQRFCHEEFEAENQNLIRQLSWPTNSFVPNVKLDEPWDISELDTLWTPTESSSELADLYRQLASALRAT
ncbi:MAG TPA: hypothetical protein VL769_00835 [Acidimicrobiia bacterium]|nr:hypothetical protein [Acidimicrobiia bacterium]